MQPNRRTTVVGTLLVAGVIVVTGCGGGGGGKRLSKKEFAAKANELCAAYNKKVNAVPTPKTDAEALASLDKLLPLDKKLIADVKNLKPPASEEATVKRVVTLGEEQAARIEALIAAVKAKDKATLNTLISEGDKNDKESKALFKQLGITECQKS
ncbi:MAG: hypothetical protein ABSB96_03120 [Gaiellaceae bacterium]